MDFKKLTETIPYKWRVQSFSKFKPQASCVAYIDARDVMDVLDRVVGPDKWQDDYKEIGGRLIAGIGIKCEDGWAWKWDTGTESNMEKEKGQMSDAFKRAAVKWGVGRFLYSLDIVYLDANEKKTDDNWPYVVDGNGQRIWDITKHINKGKKKAPPKQPPPPKFTKEEQEQLQLMKDELEKCATPADIDACWEENKEAWVDFPKNVKVSAWEHSKGIKAVLAKGMEGKDGN